MWHTSLLFGGGASVLSGTTVLAMAPDDLTAIAAIITSASTLIASVGAIYLGNRRRGEDASAKALELLLQLQAKQLQEEQAAADERKIQLRKLPPPDGDPRDDGGAAQPGGGAA